MTRPSPDSGQSAALLPDGRWLFTGGRSGAASDELAIQESDPQQPSILPARLSVARKDHSATVLPDGTVFIFGGTDAKGELVSVAELFDPATGSITTISDSGLQARARHTATLLLDGKVLVSGGVVSSPSPTADAELWNPATGKAESTLGLLNIARLDHRAALLGTGKGLIWGGRDDAGISIRSGELYDPVSSLFQAVDPDDPDALPPPYSPATGAWLAASLPEENAKDAPVDRPIALLLSAPARVTSVNSSTISLVGPAGAVHGLVIPAETGMLVFFTPYADLTPGATYTLFLKGVLDEFGKEVPFSSVSFTTKSFDDGNRDSPDASSGNRSGTQAESADSYRAAVVPSPTVTEKQSKKTQRSKSKSQKENQQQKKDNADEIEDWIPSAEHRTGKWQVLSLSSEPKSFLEKREPLAARSGKTAVAGRVVKMNGRPIAGVFVGIGAQSTVTDATGRFILYDAPAGPQQMVVDGSPVSSGGRVYASHILHVAVAAGKTNIVKPPIYLARLDSSNQITIPSPTDREIVLKHPDIPGLEIHIPKGVIIRDRFGKIVTRLGITPIPINRPPFPVPEQFPVYFTVQPAGAFVESVDPAAPRGIRVVYPNYTLGVPGTKVPFWNYNPSADGWQVYGLGTVSTDGKRIEPDEGTEQQDFMAFGHPPPPPPPPPIPPPDVTMGGPAPPAEAAPVGGCVEAADPVDCATGLFLHRVTDISLPDVTPIVVTRTYRPKDNASHAFGIGANLSYAMYLYTPTPSGSTAPQEVNLILADGGRIRFVKESGFHLNEGVWKATETPTAFQAAVLAYSPIQRIFVLTLRDGTTMTFNRFSPNHLETIADRNGNVTTLEWSGENVTKVTSPNGRYVQFAYTTNRVTSATDNLGRMVEYTYFPTGHPAAGRLESVKDQDAKIERYTYNAAGHMETVTDKRNNLMATNEYYDNGRVKKQTLADGAIWLFDYSFPDANGVTTTTITDPRTFVTKDTFNAAGYLTKQVLAFSQPEEQTYLYERDARNLVQSVIDPLNRKTTFTYDSFGNTTSVTRLSGTAGAVTNRFTYDSKYHQLTSHTDPLGHVTRLQYDAFGNLVGITDPMFHTVSIAVGEQGLPEAITDALGHSTQMAYAGSDIAGITDALGRMSRVFTDGVGRAQSAADPLGNRTQYDYDPMNRVRQVTDSRSGLTAMTYDANGNLLTVRDPRQVGTHAYTYYSRNWLKDYTNPVGKLESYEYDGLGNLKKHTDRKNQVAQYTYDPLNRIKTITFNDASTITYTVWDAGNRPREVVDRNGAGAVVGTLTWDYDLLDRLTEEKIQQGGLTTQVNYTYDDAGRRETMTVLGQPTVIYGYDDANRLTSIAQGALTVSLTYDAANRRETLTLPNGIVATYSYDNANQLASIAYARNSIALGSIAYSYDEGSRRISRSSGLDQNGAPANVTSTVHDSANRLTQRNGTTLSYDDNGNLLSDGVNTYTWNARDQLVSISGAVTANFTYDATGRRRSRTVNGTSRNFLYDGMNLVQELNGATPFANYLTGLGIDETFSRTQGTATHSYLTDALGSTIGLANAAGTITTSYHYDAYGNTSTSGIVSANTIQYTGRENDGTGLYFYRARYYSPQFGRFISSDPIGLAGGINTYAYVGGNPVSFVDPLGLWTTSIHEYLIDHAFPNLPLREREALKRSSGDADALIPGQLPAMSHTHAMSQAGEDPQTAALKWTQFLAQQQALARAACGIADRWDAFGRGLHAVADSTSPSHRGFQPWLLSDLGAHHSAETSIGIGDYLNTINLMRSYYQTTFGQTAW